MDKNAAFQVKNDNQQSPADRKLSALMQDFELIAQAASHDLKDPLRQAIIDLETLIKIYDNKPLDDEAKAHIQLSIDSISLIVRRIEILRSYSRVVQNRKLFIELACNDIAQKALRQLQPVIDAKKAHIVVDALPGVFGDGEQLTLVFKHLIDNALRFCRNESPQIHISVKEKGLMWEFAIQDNGIGIDPAYQDLVFCVFQVLENDATRRDGVGLTFSRKIIQNHGGDIRYESDGRHGTCFYFTLPKH